MAFDSVDVHRYVHLWACDSAFHENESMIIFAIVWMLGTVAATGLLTWALYEERGFKLVGIHAVVSFIIWPLLFLFVGGLYITELIVEWMEGDR